MQVVPKLEHPSLASVCFLHADYPWPAHEVCRIGRLTRRPDDAELESASQWNWKDPLFERREDRLVTGGLRTNLF